MSGLFILHPGAPTLELLRFTLSSDESLRGFVSCCFFGLKHLKVDDAVPDRGDKNPGAVSTG